MPFEPHHEPVLPRLAYLLRVLRSAMLAGVLVLGWLAIGSLGYHITAGLAWIDAMMNAAMILSGMGPVDELHTNGAKIFASAYAICSGVVFLGASAVLLGPVVHRFLHRFNRSRPEPPGGPPS